jgi:3-dehydroquinate dehydratase
MERITTQVVNKGFAGEPVVHALQDRDTLKVYDLENIKTIEYTDGNRRDAVIPNDVEYVISNHEGHLVDIIEDENGDITLFIK